MLGEGVLGEGVLGEGVLGDGVLGEGVLGDGVLGEGVLGDGMLGEGVLGDGVLGEGELRECCAHKEKEVLLSVLVLVHQRPLQGVLLQVLNHLHRVGLQQQQVGPCGRGTNCSHTAPLHSVCPSHHHTAHSLALLAPLAPPPRTRMQSVLYW